MRRKLTGIIVVILALASCGKTAPQVGTTVSQDRLASAVSQSARGSQMLAYPWSVVPGGVDSSAAMQKAMQEDPLVAAHYAGMQPSAFRKETLPSQREGYVSYRIRDKVYWTRGMVTLLAGETVLTDGNTLVRGRCGNLLSTSPRQPVAPPGLEPAEVAMNVPAQETQLMYSPAVSGQAVAAIKSFDNPKKLGDSREMTNVLPPAEARDSLPPVFVSGGRSPMGFVPVGGAGGGGASTPEVTPPATPPIPASPLPPTQYLPPAVPSPPFEVPPPMVIAALSVPPEAPVPPPINTWGEPEPPPYRPPPENLPPGNPPPGTPWAPPPSSPPSDPPPDPPPPLRPPGDNPPVDPPGPPPPDSPPDVAVPEPGAWVLLALGCLGIALGVLRKKS